ncbi:MAG: tetratricopeptide repeat protein [Acidobacteria bacterium]|nr:MAG: tetratricopeptide repeat protein [Acidobacteriota bacterium]
MALGRPVAESVRIEELRRRVEKDPASIAFAQLAEEYRRAGRVREAIETCETGLARHPGYLSARVTLGRALLETGELDAAQEELKRVLRTAPENLAALRGLAEIHHRRGELHEALAHYRTALEFARHDAELEHVIGEITAQLEPSVRAPKVVDGLSFEEAAAELLAFSSGNGEQPGEEAPAAVPEAVPEPLTDPSPEAADEPFTVTLEDALPDIPLIVVPPPQEPAAEPPVAPGSVGSAEEGDRQIAALERWLEAIVAEREKRNAP